MLALISSVQNGECRVQSVECRRGHGVTGERFPRGRKKLTYDRRPRVDSPRFPHPERGRSLQTRLIGRTLAECGRYFGGEDQDLVLRSLY